MKGVVIVGVIIIIVREQFLHLVYSFIVTYLFIDSKKLQKALAYKDGIETETKCLHVSDLLDR